MSHPHIIMEPVNFVTCKFSKVSESCNKTRSRSKGSEGLPACLWRGPTWCLRDVNSVSTWLVNPPHTVWLVPVDVCLGGGILMTLVMLAIWEIKTSQKISSNFPVILFEYEHQSTWVDALYQVESPLSSFHVSKAFQPFWRQTHSKPGIKTFRYYQSFVSIIYNSQHLTRPVGISSGEVARYSWFSSLKPAPSTTIFKISTSFRSFPQSYGT